MSKISSHCQAHCDICLCTVSSTNPGLLLRSFCYIDEMAKRPVFFMTKTTGKSDFVSMDSITIMAGVGFISSFSNSPVFALQDIGLSVLAGYTSFHVRFCAATA